MFFDDLVEFVTEAVEPCCDMYHCYECDKDFELSDCPSFEEQDGWEMPHYTVHSCPVCDDDGGEYSMSEERAKEWLEWSEKR